MLTSLKGIHIVLYYELESGHAEVMELLVKHEASAKGLDGQLFTDGLSDGGMVEELLNKGKNII